MNHSAICGAADVTSTIHFGEMPRYLFTILIGSLVIACSAFGGELGALCSAAKDFVSAAKTQQGVLITYPTASELAASTVVYAAAKERYYSELRSAMPILIAIGLKQRARTSEVEEFRSAFRQFGRGDEKGVANATTQMLKRFDNDQAVATAEKEFLEAQEIEAAFTRDFDGLDSA